MERKLLPWEPSRANDCVDGTQKYGPMSAATTLSTQQANTHFAIKPKRVFQHPFGHGKQSQQEKGLGNNQILRQRIATLYQGLGHSGGKSWR